MYAGGNLNRHFFGGLLHSGTVHPLRAGGWESFRTVMGCGWWVGTESTKDTKMSGAVCGGRRGMRYLDDRGVASSQQSVGYDSSKML